MRTALPPAHGQTDRSRGFASDPSYVARNFPGLGMAMNRPRGFVVAWQDNHGHEHTSQTVGSYEAAETLMKEILAGDVRTQLVAGDRVGQPAAQAKRTPQRVNIRVIESRT